MPSQARWPSTPWRSRSLATLPLRARVIVEGALLGPAPQPAPGTSVEFAEHKEYSPGDEIRHIDWKAYGKVDRYYVKRFEHETELRALPGASTPRPRWATGAAASPS